jgi:DNA-binding transcriptional LysR family regulator|tara:strand:- start:2142 stop:2972 length:831 start_codon:yes stop_codon:yes gene_type:complete
VSRQIQKLEDDLDIPLFERSPNGLKLTSAGESFARHAQLVLKDAERLYSEIDAIKGIQKGHIEIATVEGPSIELIPRVIKKFRERFPNISVGVHVIGSSKTPELIINGDVDIGLAFDLEHLRDLNQLWVQNHILGAVVAQDHPLASKKETSLQECSAYPLILSKKGLSIHQHLSSFINLIGPSHQVIETNSVELSRKLALSGMGVAFQTIIGIEEDLANQRLFHIPITRPNIMNSELGVYVRANRTLPVAADHFVRDLIYELSQATESATTKVIPF